MKYFFIFGNHPELSLAEIYALYGNKVKYLSFSSGALVIESEKKLDLVTLNNRLGGTVKMGEVFQLLPDLADANTRTPIKKILELATKPFFGFSLYGANHDFLRLALGLKKELKIADRSPRYVTSREKVLSSVVVEQNKLTSGGTEIVIIKTHNGYWLGKTTFVQPFKALSKRDYGRPARDDYSGMLPPKLAQIMINLAGADFKQTILDPFCGSGTIISEAALIGYENLIGSDVSAKAIEDSEDNFEWLKERYELRVMRYEFKVLDAKKISKDFKANSVDAIITEPYLGPQRGERDLRKIKRELDELYSDALSQFAKVLKAGGKVVMIWPKLAHNAQRTTHNENFINIEPEIRGFKMIDVWPSEFKNNMPKELVYGREGQRVWRKIVILQKK